MTIPVAITLAVPERLWHWEAEYAEGDRLAEYDDAGQHFWREIEHERLTAFYLVPAPGAGLPAFGVEVRAGERLIFLRRVSHTLVPELDAAGGLDLAARGVYTWHVLGLQTTAAGANVAVYQFVSEEGLCFLSTDPQANERIAIGIAEAGEESDDAQPE